LLEMVGRRKRFIKYLSKKKPEDFVKLAKKTKFEN
jgi:ribosomal protein S15P/S13E